MGCGGRMSSKTPLNEVQTKKTAEKNNSVKGIEDQNSPRQNESTGLAALLAGLRGGSS